MPSNFKFTDSNQVVHDASEVFVKKASFLDNFLYSWGSDSYGELGLGDLVQRSSPVQVGSLINWKSLSCGSFFSIVVKTDGTLWAWGKNNFNGQLGLGLSTTSHKSSPVQVGSLTDWKTVACGANHTVALKIDGSLWAWGSNSSGKLGDGTTVSKSSPIQIGSLTDWKYLAVKFNTSYAIKTDGTLWAWGVNTYGQLGLGDTSNRSSPVQVGTLNTWKAIACGYSSMYAIKLDGSLWVCGRNNNGQLGLGISISTNISSPVQVGALTNWKQIDAEGSVLAVKLDGTLWAWGRNNTGQLGLGLDGTSHKSSPVQVGALTNWKTVFCGNSSCFSIKMDRSLWAWGTNASGQLGLGDVDSRSSPVQVVALNNWKTVACGYHTLALSNGQAF